MNILAIESSCDETAAAVVSDGITVLSSVISSSTLLHRRFGGILPELAARKQLDYMLPVITQTLSQAFPDVASQGQALQHIDAIAVTVGPGLIGSLLVGVEAAKTLAYVTNKPLIPVNHVHAHIFAAIIGHDVHFPAIALVVSGGHTELFLMKNEREIRWISGTIDDAAGEAFDKTARLLGFENQGGVAIEKAAQRFTINDSRFTIKLPRPLLHDKTLNFSFSGLKTAVHREWEKQAKIPELIPTFAHEIQEAITDVLVAKTMQAADQFQTSSILVAGGVAANLRLREKFQEKLGTTATTVYYPPIELCTDNAVTIGSAAFFLGEKTVWDAVTAQPNLSVDK